MSQIIPQINAKRDKSSAGRHARPRRDGQWGVIQSEPELEATGVLGLQLLQVLTQDDVLFSLK